MACRITSPYCGDMNLAVKEPERSRKEIVQSRQNPLVVTQKTWVDFHEPFIRHLKETREKIEEERYQKYLKEGSEAMCENWVDSVKNVRIQVDEAIAAHKAQVEAERLARVRELDESKLNERLEFCEEVRKILAHEKRGPRALTSAFLRSLVIKEREAQIALKREKINKLKDKDLAEGRFLVEDAARFIAEQTGKDSGALKVKRALWQELKETGDERTRQMSRTMAIENDKCIEDIRLANEEYANMKAQERKKIEKDREIFIKNFEWGSEKYRAKNKKMRQVMEIDNNIADLYADSKRRIDNTRSETLRKKVQDRMARKEQAQRAYRPYEYYDERVFNDRVSREEAQHYARLEAAEMDRRNRHMMEQEERRMMYARCQVENGQRAFEMEQRKRWEMMNNFKQREIHNQFTQRKVLRRRTLRAQNERMLMEQMHATKKFREQRQMAQDNFYEPNVNYKHNDHFFFDYAKVVEGECKERELTPYPVQRAIHQYKVDSAMIPKARKNYKECPKKEEKTEEPLRPAKK